MCWIDEWIIGYTFIYIDLTITSHGLGIVTPNCFVGKNTPEKNIQKARAGGRVPSQVNTQRQFIPTNLPSLAVSWWRKLPPVGSPSLCGPYINKATLPLDEFLVLQEKWYSFSLKDKQSFSRQALYMSFRQNTAMININTVLLRL